MPISPDKERRSRILDAASERFVRFGYDKTTVADIARAARISKGAFYLAFPSKDELFERLLLREMHRFSEAWFAQVQAHPRGGTLGPMYEAMLVALEGSPFVAMIFRRDRELLGRYLAKPDNFFNDYATGQPTRAEAIAAMQAVGAVRADVDPVVVAHIMNLLSHGLFASDPMAAHGPTPPIEDSIRGVADMLDRAFTPAGGGNAEAGMQLLTKFFEGGREAFERIQRERFPDPEDDENERAS